MNIFGLGGLYGVHGGFGYNSLGTGSLGAGYLGTGYLGTGYLSTGYLGTGSLGTGSFGYNSVNNAALKHVNGINSGYAQAASPSFQHVLAASIKGEGLAALLSAQYPDIKYQVMDTSKIDAALWQRNDYPFERFYAEKADTSVLDWKPSAQEPSMTDARVQARLNAARGKYAVIVPPELEEKLDGNTELAQDIFCKITALAMQQDTVPRTIDSFSIALDKDGNIANYRFSGGGGQLMFPYGTLLERTAAQKTGTAKTLHQKRQHHLNE